MKIFHRALVVVVACAGLVAPAVLADGAAPAAAKKPPTVKAKMAFVDVDRAVGETEDGLRAKAMLKKRSDREQQHVTAVEEQLRVMQDELTQLAKTGAPSVQAKAIAYQQKLQDYNDMIKRINQDIALREDQLFAPIEAKVHDIFERIGAEKGIDVVVDKKIIQYVNSAKVEDLTEQVIREYNWGAGVGGKPGVGNAPSAATSAAPPAPSAAPTASDKPKTVINPI